MVTLTLGDRDMIEVFDAVNHRIIARDADGRDMAALLRARDALKCALLLCRCSEPQATAP